MYILTGLCVHRKSQYTVHCKPTPCVCGPCVWTWRHGSRQMYWQPTLTTVPAGNHSCFIQISDKITLLQCAVLCCVVACLCVCLCECPRHLCQLVGVSLRECLTRERSSCWQLWRTRYVGMHCINACPSHWMINWMLSTDWLCVRHCSNKWGFPCSGP